MQKSKADKHTSHLEGQSSKQGEHIFNAVNDLVKKMAKETMLYTDNDVRRNEKSSVMIAAKALSEKIKELERSRDNEEFRTADEGDPKNASRYGDFCRDTKAAIMKIISTTGNTAEGSSEMHSLYNEMEEIVVDKIALKNKLASLKGKPQKLAEFKEWKAKTYSLMRVVFLDLRNFAIEMDRSRNAE